MHPRAPELKALAEKWAVVPPAERVTSQPFLIDFCNALGVARPDPGRGDYSFEYPVQTTNRKTGVTTSNWIDLYRKDHFILESKHVAGDRTAERVLGAAYGQAKGYAADIPHAPPPFLMVLNVGRTLLVWDRWGGNYGGVNAARRIDLTRLWERPEEIELLRAVWENPASLDPSVRGRQVTRDVAEKLALLSASLEKRGLDSERVAKFLIRCVFTMFAEDVGLLADKPFQNAIRELGSDPARFTDAMERLWRAMDTGDVFGWRKLLRFNGHFFHEAEALPLDRADLVVLAEAAEADWGKVEPTIFGTLLMRALDAAERHRLGAEYTPREYVERVVRQTVDVPIRERWAPVQAEVLQLTGTGRRKDRNTALGRLREFHAWMRSLRFLDPACGSGNFLYVTLDMVKRVELEVLRAIEEITGNPELGIEEVGPWQFHGIEKKAWAREIAELTLWIGFHQFWMEHHKGVNPPEPVLQDTGTLELRDAVLEWDEIVEIPEKSRPDPTPRIVHPVTGKLVPDPNARLPYYEYRGARQAPWPQADFIVGNPPYIGQGRMREALGWGYVDSLRTVYAAVPYTADLVMYWWYRAAEEIAVGRSIRAGLITTNTIVQTQNRALVEAAATRGARVVWAIADHPWVDEANAADIRVAMTVIAYDPTSGTLVRVDDEGNVIGEVTVDRLNTDLSSHADVATVAAVPLVANEGLASPGFKLHGSGFILTAAEAQTLGEADGRNWEIIKEYLNGRDLASRSRGAYVIDFGLRTDQEAREYPILYGVVRARVKPERDANSRAVYREFWWRFGEPRREFRNASSALPRYITTVETAKHRFFLFLDASIAPDNKLICFALTEALYLGILSSAIHVTWSLATGGRLGVGNDPVYVKTTCFDAFPFPDPSPELRARIADIAEQLDKHRKNALARDERVTITKSYNVVEKLRSGEPLTPQEREIHQIAACGVLKDLHDELDLLVAEAYGWPWPMDREEILERLVAPHDERVEEEKQGIVRWLRPDYQIPRFAKTGAPSSSPTLE
ncbi:MAG TPA: DNA methyltransferase, partial [Longimicrobium sp.]|nr:DNA methyltransferase [Longimicrobium sp.]